MTQQPKACADWTISSQNEKQCGPLDKEMARGDIKDLRPLTDPSIANSTYVSPHSLPHSYFLCTPATPALG